MSSEPSKAESNGADSPDWQTCIRACNECAALCERIAAFCLRGGELPELIRCAVSLRTCADVCHLTARLVAQESEFLQEYCALCAEVCHACRGECLKHSAIDCFRLCAEACLKCDQACQHMAV